MKSNSIYLLLASVIGLSACSADNGVKSNKQSTFQPPSINQQTTNQPNSTNATNQTEKSTKNDQSQQSLTISTKSSRTLVAILSVSLYYRGIF